MDAPELEVYAVFEGDVATVTIVGEIDLVTSTRLNRELDAVLDARPARLRLDLAAVAFMDTSGIAILLKARRRALAQGARFAVISTSRVIQRLLEITGLASLMADE
jgi:anti-anti-sigma factor